MASALTVNDVTGLNPVAVLAIAEPSTIEEVQAIFRDNALPVSVGGGHFSMGGTTASPGTLHLDMRRLNRILWFSPEQRTIRVQAGVRWCDIQRFIDPHGLAVKIMQTYANFTVGGSLSVNVHGRYIGLGPLVLSVRAISMVLASGELVEASPQQNSRLYYAAIGGYGAIGVIVAAELDLAENCRVARVEKKMPAADYPAYFRSHVRDTGRSVFHNADIYLPHGRSVRAVTWEETRRSVTVRHRLQQHRRAYPLERYFLWAVTETPLGKWRREHIIDTVLYMKSAVHWRNYEAGYDAAELEPPSRADRTYVLQEYFVPVARLSEFMPRMCEILARHRVNALNVSIRHALADPGTLMAWARGETFAFVLYYKQRTRRNARERVAVWTRELIEAVLACGGTYYLPYQPHATAEQFHRAYPRAEELFALKRELDPAYRLRNSLWDKYYAPANIMKAAATAGAAVPSEFHAVYSDVRWHDGFYRFLQNIFHLFPEDRLHTLIKEACELHTDDAAIYRHVQSHLPGIKPFLSELTYAIPSLLKQKREMTRQTLELMEGRRDLDGYVEIGSTGRYVRGLQGALGIRGDIVLINDVAPGSSPVDIAERGQFGRLGRWVPLDDYAPIAPAAVADASADLVSCFIGLHHAAPARLPAFVASIARVLRPGGVFILRDHDAGSAEMKTFVSLAHTVFNAGLGVPWETNRDEPRHFEAVTHWVQLLAGAGLEHTGKKLLQEHDPSDNVLMAFVKKR